MSATKPGALNFIMICFSGSFLNLNGFLCGPLRISALKSMFQRRKRRDTRRYAEQKSVTANLHVAEIQGPARLFTYTWVRVVQSFTERLDGARVAFSPRAHAA